MTKTVRTSFVSLAILTVLMPWAILCVGRGPVILSLFWLLFLSLLVGSIVMLRKSQQLAMAGFVALLLTFFFMMIVPSLARGD